MGFRYSKEDLNQVERLVAEGLTSREIAKRLNRSEAGIRNIRYRQNLRTETEDNIKSLQRMKKGLEDQVRELDQTITVKSGEIRSLEDRKEHYDRLLHSGEESVKRMIEDRLITLKLEKPELFYMTQAEQIGQLGALIVKWILS